MGSFHSHNFDCLPGIAFPVMKGAKIDDNYSTLKMDVRRNVCNLIVYNFIHIFMKRIICCSMCIYIITIYVPHTSKKNFFFLHLESRNVNFTVKIQGWIHVLSFFM